jgi:CBS domain-containing protein
MGTPYFSTAPASDVSVTMDSQTVAWLSQIQPFGSLPKPELEKMIQAMHVEVIPAGTILFLQGRTQVENLHIIKSGSLELHNQQTCEKYQKSVLKEGEIFAPQCELFLQDLAKQKSTLKEGEIFGGISLLLNAGIADKTAKATRDSTFYLIPGQVFLDICNRHPAVSRFFVDSFSQKMTDASYAAMIVSEQAEQFLLSTVPFSFLPESEIAAIASELSVIYHPKDQSIFTQGISRIDALYIIQKGAAERYFEESGQFTLKDAISEGSLFGGISMLLNNSISIRSLKTTEDTHFYTWPRQRFLDVCNRFESFSEYFTDTFGKRMLDRSYASIVARTIQPREESLQYLNQSIEDLYQQNIVYCPMDMTIQSAAELMTRRRCSSILVRNAEGVFVGIVTDNDLRQKVIATGLSILQPISAIMSTPLRTISQKALVFEALMTMMQENMKHMAVTGPNDTVVGIITNKDILASQGQSPLFLIREIQSSDSLDELTHLQAQLPAVIQNLIRNGAKAGNLTRLITTVSDAILVKLLDMAIAEMGQPPCRFAFMVMGSEGRMEQTLKTDQDNAIIYEDPSESSAEEVRAYFMALAETVCTWLDQVGYDFCKGDVMAKNPKWCQPVSVWKEYFSNWTHQAEAEDLLQASIFFDFRGGYGDMAIVSDLRKYLMDTLLGWAGFFRHMTENALYFKSPLGFFRNFIVESKGEYRDSFDIKSAMMPIIDIIRIYSLKYGIAETNTPERMLQLYYKKILTWDTYSELEHAYGFLMQLRFSRQVNAVLIDKTGPNNYVNPKKLTRIEQTMLKEIFARIDKMQKHISFEFTGS